MLEVKESNMARIRTIKPEFPQSESMGALSRDARLLFIMLWTVADDDGRTRAASRMLASILFPYDDDAPKLMPKWLDELDQADVIIRYVVDGAHYIQIKNWLRHQKIDHPVKSKLPDPSHDNGNENNEIINSVNSRPQDQKPEVLARPREVSRELPSNSGNLAPDLGPGSVLDRDLLDMPPGSPREVSRGLAKRKAAPPAKCAHTMRDDFSLSEVGINFALDRGWDQPRIQQGFEKFCSHAQATGRKLVDWDAGWRTWVLNDYGGKGGVNGNGYHRKRHSSDIAREMADELRALERAAVAGGTVVRLRDG